MLRDATEEKQLEDIRKLYESSFPKSEKKPFEFMRKKSKEGCFDMLAIEDEAGKFCGLAIMMLAGGWALLDYLAIDPGCQGTGLGSRTLEELRRRYRKERIVVEIESTALPESMEEGGSAADRQGIEEGGSTAVCQATEEGGSAADRQAMEESRSAVVYQVMKDGVPGDGGKEDRDVIERSGEAGGIGGVQAVSGDSAGNRRERLRRKAFYLRNGMVPMEFAVDLFGVEMEVLTFGGQITFEQYHGIYAEVLPENMAQKVKKVPASRRAGAGK